MGILRVKVSGAWVDIGIGGPAVYATIAARDAAMPAAGAGVGAQSITTDTGTLWMVVPGPPLAWAAVGGRLPRFRLIGGGAGQSIPSGWSTANWATGAGSAYDPWALTAAGVFICPAAYPGRWRFDYTQDIQAWNAGLRQTTFQASNPAGTNFGYQSTTAVSATIPNFFTASAEYAMVAGTTVRAMAYQDAGTLAINSNGLSNFQGQYIGPA